MAVRTSDAAVRLIATDLPASSTFDTTPFIETANALVTRECAPNPNYDAAALELGERWLSAHFCHIKQMKPASEQAGSVQESAQYKVALNLQVTVYGQQAMLLLPELAALNRRTNDGNSGPGLHWLGKRRPC